MANELQNSEIIRKTHLSHEANIRALGLLYYFNSAMMLLGAVGIVLIATTDPSSIPESTTTLVVSAVVALFLGIVFAFVGRGLRTLTGWARTVGILFAVVGLLVFPIGTLINAAFLYLFLSGKGAYVFTPEYQNVIAATPHVKYKTSMIVWVALGVLVAILVLGVLALLAPV